MSLLRVLVADDSKAMRNAYRNILRTKDDIEVVAIASDGQEALEKSIELAPDVVVLDVRMPKLDGLAVANRIVERNSQTAIVLISAYDDLAFVRAIIHNGASRKAYILKNSLDDIAEFIRVVEVVAEGGAVLHGTIAQNLIGIYNRLPATRDRPLTETEERVLRYMLEGYNAAGIAQTLRLPLETVDALATSLCEKLGLAVQDDLDRSPQVVQAMVNLCIS